MATNVSVTSSYAGEWSGDYFIKSVIELASLQHMMVKEGIKTKFVLPNLTSTGGLVAATCDFSAQGSYTVAEKVLELKGLQVNKEVCLKDVLPLWDTMSMGSSYPGDNLPTTFQEFFLANEIAQIKAEIETMIWQGDGTTNEFTGFIPRFLLDGTVNDVSTPVALTESNIVDKIKATLAVVPRAILDSADKPNIYTSPYSAELFAYKQQSLGYIDKYNADNPIPLTFAGKYQIVECPGMPVDTIVVARPTNLWFGTGDAADYESMRIVDMRNTTADNKVRFRVDAGMNTQFRYGAEVGLYTTFVS